jgi:hypothetical protein
LSGDLQKEREFIAAFKNGTFEHPVPFWAFVGTEGINSGLRVGWRMNVEVGTTLGFDGAGMLRIGDGEETGWGINEGKVLPRLVGGVM